MLVIIFFQQSQIISILVNKILIMNLWYIINSPNLTHGIPMLYFFLNVRQFPNLFFENSQLEYLTEQKHLGILPSSNLGRYDYTDNIVNTPLQMCSDCFLGCISVRIMFLKYVSGGRFSYHILQVICLVLPFSDYFNYTMIFRTVIVFTHSTRGWKYEHWVA